MASQGRLAGGMGFSVLNRKQLMYAVHRRMVPDTEAAAPLYTLTALREAHSCELADDPRLQDALQKVTDLWGQHANAGKLLSLNEFANTVLWKEDGHPVKYETMAFDWHR